MKKYSLKNLKSFVQLLKQLQLAACPEMGNTLVRPPRLNLEGQELDETIATIKHALANDPLVLVP